MTIQELKDRIDILDVVSAYCVLIKHPKVYQAKENPLRVERTSSLFVYIDTKRWFDFGSGEGGDIIDFIENVENISQTEAKVFLEEKYLRIDAHTKNARPHQYREIPKMKAQTIEEEQQLIKELEIKAQRYLSSFKRKKWNSFLLDNEITGEKQHVISVAPMFEKLFEGIIIPSEEKFAKYLFEKIIGYDAYFNCPVIIVRNEDERVVDIVKYKPHRDGKALNQKYLVTKNVEKPDKRGRNFVFPFQRQMILIAHKEKYCFIGEGLKNAVNASMMGVPFISIESSSSIDKKLIEFLKSPRMRGISLVGAMDGDEAGSKAHKKLSEQIEGLKNMFNFNSGVDFTDYLKDIRKDGLHGNKKAS